MALGLAQRDLEEVPLLSGSQVACLQDGWVGGVMEGVWIIIPLGLFQVMAFGAELAPLGSDNTLSGTILVFCLEMRTWRD